MASTTERRAGGDRGDQLMTDMRKLLAAVLVALLSVTSVDLGAAEDEAEPPWTT